jgi:glycosyltransferase involved in cell wall biosynthesis
MRAAAAADPRITFCGDVAEDAKDAFFDLVDVVVIPSEWEENAPLVAVEAAVRGIPTIVSDRGGLPETPEATVFRARDRDSLVAALEALASSNGRLAAASARLLESQERFLWSTHVAAVERELVDAASQPDSARKAIGSAR